LRGASEHGEREEQLAQRESQPPTGSPFQACALPDAPHLDLTSSYHRGSTLATSGNPFRAAREPRR
jgi:hypothetical protein